MALAGPRSSKKPGALAKWVDDNQADIVYSQEKRKARKAIIEAIDAEEKDKGKGKAESAKKEPVDDESGVDSGEESGVDDSELCDSESEVDFDNESDDEIRERAIKRRRERKIAQKLKEWEDNNARNYVLWHRVQKEVHGELRIRASRESAAVAGDNHVDVQFDRYLRVSKLLEMKDWIHKDLPSLPMEARVLHHKAQKRVLELEETVTRLLQDVGYAADISMGASPTPAPFRRDLPQSGTHQARTSTPRRTGKSDTIHMKRKALMTIPQKIADVDNNSEESDEEEMVTEEKKREAHEELVTEERKGESHEEDVTKCDACIQAEPEKARPEDSEEESEEEEEPVEEGEAEEEEQEDEMAESEVNAESEEKREADKEQEADNEVAFEAESDVEYVQVDHVDPASEQMRSREVKFRVDVAHQWVRYKTLPHGNCITHCLMMIEGVTEPHAFKSWETMTNEEQCAAETKADNYREQIYKEAIEMNRRATPGYRRPEEGLRDELFHEVCSVHTVTEEGNIGKPIMQEKWLTQWAVEAWCSMTGKSVAYLHVVRDFDPKIDPVVGMYVFSKSEEGKVTHVAFKPNENGQSALACFAQQCREWEIEYAVEVTRGHATLRKVPPGLKRRRWSVKK
ncbi:hypothetical protein J8273_7638 [Carpediemonas membranifera]|uniref:Uncharacterized protein n=1 Tax=Carpediemonas membranifera TaxID=201153 RepID=A0A8J6AY53_9EUKA|nr:hypothetical protein J8273_7638 [Carpediemonas membranifera]|eukprot:KAG9391293.1 hypothetical protein J8273_7638 [Carpediemonas membranifera]